jgi:hypothetical protein
MTKDKLKWAAIRALRVLVAIILAGLAVKYGKSDWYILIAPALAGIDKYVRS